MAIRNKTTFYRLPAFRVLGLQTLICIAVAGIALIAYGQQSAASILAGGVLVVVPQAYFAAKTFRYYGARSTGAIVRAMWSGHAGKMILTAVLFALVFTGLKSLNVAALIASYVGVMLLGIFAQFLTRSF